MKWFQFKKSPQTHRRRRKKSHKWIDKVKSDAENMSYAGSFEENALVKAAILSTAGGYSFTREDFRLESTEDTVFLQNMLWVIEALQERYRDYLQYARWLAIKKGIEVIDNRQKGHQKADTKNSFTSQPGVPSPNLEDLMGDEADRRLAGYRRRREVEAQRRLARFLQAFDQMIAEANRLKKSSKESDQKANGG
jgi:hypothetical protein